MLGFDRWQFESRLKGPRDADFPWQPHRVRSRRKQLVPDFAHDSALLRTVILALCPHAYEPAGRPGSRREARRCAAIAKAERLAFIAYRHYRCGETSGQIFADRGEAWGLASASAVKMCLARMRRKENEIKAMRDKAAIL